MFGDLSTRHRCVDAFDDGPVAALEGLQLDVGSELKWHIGWDSGETRIDLCQAVRWCVGGADPYAQPAALDLGTGPRPGSRTGRNTVSLRCRSGDLHVRNQACCTPGNTVSQAVDVVDIAANHASILHAVDGLGGATWQFHESLNGETGRPAAQRGRHGMPGHSFWHGMLSAIHPRRLRFREGLRPEDSRTTALRMIHMLNNDPLRPQSLRECPRSWNRSSPHSWWWPAASWHCSWWVGVGAAQGRPLLCGLRCGDRRHG